MKGPPPKHPSVRARQNRAVSARVLRPAPAGVDVPELPADREWHPMTVAWWRDVWASPMAAEFLASDVHGLLIVAVLVDRFWREPSAALAAELRLQRQCFGLTPMDRRRLQWSIERAEEAVERTATRRRPRPAGDPRALLRPS